MLYHGSISEKTVEAGKKAHWVEPFAIKTDNLSLNPTTHKVKEGNQLLQVVLSSDFHISTMAHVCIHMLHKKDREGGKEGREGERTLSWFVCICI